MSTDIFSLNMGITRCYLIRGTHGIVMIDCGMPNKQRTFEKAINDYNISPSEIKLIVLTHAHVDNMGSARAIKLFTGAKIAINENESSYLENGEFTWPAGVTGWGKFSRLFLVPYMKAIRIPKTKADVILKREDYSLADHGIDGKIIFTPGYSSGSVSVLLNTGEAFVGSLGHNGFPYRSNPGFPIYSDKPEMIKESWRSLIERGARMIYPDHGNPFPVSEIKQYLN